MNLWGLQVLGAVENSGFKWAIELSFWSIKQIQSVKTYFVNKNHQSVNDKLLNIKVQLEEIVQSTTLLKQLSKVKLGE